MGYENLRHRKAGQEAEIELAASDRANAMAEEQLMAREQALIDADSRTNELEAAEARGIASGSRAGKMDAAKFFSDQGFIPRQVFGEAQSVFGRMEAEDDMRQDRGLSISPEMSQEAMMGEADNISTKLLEASMQGAPNDQINSAIEQLNVSDAVKKQAAKMFIDKRSSINENGPSNQGQVFEPGSAVRKVNSPITRHAADIAGQTDSLIQRLHERLSGQQGQQGPQGQR